MKTTINLHVEIECEDDSVDKGLVADFICAKVSKKFKKVNGIIVFDADELNVLSQKEEVV